MAMPSAGESSARVISTRWALPPWNWSSRTRLPTETASSTSAVRSWGVETETSTPQLSLKSHWFFGWLTRATTRGTANSCLARRETTRLSSSSPVAATTTSTVARPAASSEDDLAGVGRHPGDVEGRAQRAPPARGPARRRSTSCPLAWRSAAMAVPTLPAPAMATFTPSAVLARAVGAGQGARRARASASSSTARCSTSPSWPTSSRESRRALPGTGHRHQAHLARVSQVAQPPARPRLGQRPVDQGEASRSGRTSRRRPRRAGAAGAPGRWSRSPWPRWGCRGAGRSRPAAGRRSGPPRWGSCRSPGRCAR